MSNVTIREAKSSDAADIARVDFETYWTTYAGIVPMDFLNARTYEQRTSVWQSRYSDSSKLWHGWFIYVAEDKDGKVVGFAGGGLQHGDVQGYSGELGFIYLFRSHQHQGIGRQLAAVVPNRLKQQGHNSMIVWVFAQNPNRAFYEALGGQPVSEKEVNYGGKNIKEIAYGWQDLSLFVKMQIPDAEIKKIEEGLDCGYKFFPPDSKRCCKNCNNYHPIDKTRGICYEYEVLPNGGCNFFTPKDK